MRATPSSFALRPLAVANSTSAHQPGQAFDLLIRGAASSTAWAHRRARRISASAPTLIDASGQVISQGISTCQVK